MEWTKRAVNQGLHVLCGKPLTVSAEQSHEPDEFCEDRVVTLLEAFMYRYHLRTERTAASDQLGGVGTVHSVFLFRSEGYDIYLNPNLVGGASQKVAVTL